MNLKTKRKTKIALLSIVFMCLFIISFGTSIKAADPMTYEGVDYSSKIEVQDLPIKIGVKFQWYPGVSTQRLDYVWVDYDIKKDIIREEYRLECVCLLEGSRPTTVHFTIPSGNFKAGDTVYFKISYQWDKSGSQNMLVEIDTTYSVEIYEEGGIEEEAERDLILYIILGSAGAVVLIGLFVIYSIKRRR